MIQVRATKLGYYGHIRRREGALFTITSEKDFSPRWMERTDGAAVAKPSAPPTVQAQVRTADEEAI